jgi:muramidase (phage lysozyme)
MAVVTQIDQNIQRIRKLVVTRTKLKADAFQRKTLLQKRRIENAKRSSRETALEAPDLVRTSVGRNVLTNIASTGKNFLSRILESIAYLGAGWLLSNIPTIIGYGKEFVARLQKGREILSDMWSSITGTFKALGKVFTAALDNLKTFDFLDSEKRVRTEVNNLIDEVNKIGKSLDESYELITKPFVDDQGRGTYSGQPIPQPGSGAAAAPAPTAPAPTPTQTETETVPTTPTPQSSSAGGWSPVLDIIGKAESSRDGYNSIAPNDFHPRLSEMTLQEAYNSRGVRNNGAGALGRYQFTDPFFEKASYAGLGPDDIFNPANQDSMAIALSRVQVGVTLESIKQDPIRAGNLLAQIWAGLPLLSGPNKGKSYYQGQNGNAARISVQEYEAALRKVGGVQRAKTQPQTSRIPALPPTNTLAGQNYGDPRDGRRHAGQDFDAGTDEVFYSRIGGQVMRILKDPNGYGNYVDIFNRHLGVTERIAEGTENLVRVGDKVQPGTPIQRGTHQTGVFHYEIRKGGGESYGFEGTLNPLEFLKTITPERKGEQIVMVNRTETSAPTTTMYGKDSNIIIDSLSGLNSYIRKNMLARLAE